MILTDTHTHLYSSKYDTDRDAMMKRALAAGIQRIFLPAIDSETHDQLVRLADAYPDNCFPMMGLHPCSVEAATMETELVLIETWHEKRKFLAVGEIGIDLYWDKTKFAVQQDAFARQIDLAKKLNLPIVIHSRNAFYECYEIVKAKQDGNLRGIFHCFSDGIKEAEKVLELGGFYLGIGGVLTFKNSGVDKVMEQVDLKHIVLETDSPYLAPVPHRGQRNETAYIVHVAQKLAEIKQVSLEEIARITTDNSRVLFNC
jgi:TatD DNase family protein